MLSKIQLNKVKMAHSHAKMSTYVFIERKRYNKRMWKIRVAYTTVFWLSDQNIETGTCTVC